MILCNAPFCQNPKYHKNGKYRTWCKQHISERTTFKVKAYKEVFPLWAVKRCKVHGLLKLHETYLHRLSKDASSLLCKKCTKSYINSRYDPEKEKVRNAKRASQKRNRELKCLYGITLDEYNKMLKGQNNSCAICKTTDIPPKRKGFDVDHCHTTKKVRGLLCHSCNVGIGFLKDDVEILKTAILYLSK